MNSLAPSSRLRRRINVFRYAAPSAFYAPAGMIARWCALVAIPFALLGLYLGFIVAPTDATQGEVYRILFIHVPAAWLSMLIYLVMAVWAAMGFILNTRLSGMMATALAPTGAMFTLLALVTGSIWGKPTWGTWWVWDARLTSELILLFLYLGLMGLHNAIEDPRRADRAAGLLALVGSVNLPVIYFSVRWWNTLHQGSSIRMDQAPSMAMTMVAAMLALLVACWLYAIAVTLIRLRCIIIEREGNTEWARRITGAES
jgi:heme exporter protein C